MISNSESQFCIQNNAILIYFLGNNIIVINFYMNEHIYIRTSSFVARYSLHLYMYINTGDETFRYNKTKYYVRCNGSL